jgi:hypothetical protein
VECQLDPAGALAGTITAASALSDASLSVRYSRRIPSQADELLLGKRPISTTDGQGGIMVQPPRSVSLGAALSLHNGISLLFGFKRGSMQF